MYKLIRRYLRRVDGGYLALCAVCSALSILVLVSIGQTQLGSNNKASVQLLSALFGLLLAVVFSTVDYRALARAWPLHGTVAWGIVLPTLFLHNFRAGFVTIGYDAGGTSNYSWYRVGGMTFQPAELAKISFILTLALHLSRVRGQVNRPRNLLLVLLHILLPVAAIHIQGDDGTALVFLGIGFIMLYAGGLSHWLVGGGLAAGVGGAAALLALRPGILKGYQFKRILAVLTPDDPALADIARYVAPEELLRTADLVSLHCPLTADTYHMINADTIQMMRPNAILVNTSRGGLIDTEALIHALRARKFGGVGLDVYEDEDGQVFEDFSDTVLRNEVVPILLSFPNVVITSHQAFFTRTAMQSIAITTMENARAFALGLPLVNEVEE